MFLSKSNISKNHTQVFKHPWAETIKPTLINKIKFAHNSVNNTKYPESEKKILHKNHIKFIVIGNRLAKEFIYCSNIVNGLHKYRGQIFGPPVIQGVTSVEWPNELNKLKLQYRDAFCLEGQVAVIMNDTFLGGEKELREIIEAKFRYHMSLDYCKEALQNFVSFVRSSRRPCVYMHVAINGDHIGTLIFMLFSDIVPNTCENFLRLCNSKKGGYSGTPVHRIVKDCWIQCGGYGLKSIELDCENYIVPHDRRGVLGMANNGRNVDCSTQFFVLLQPAPWMAHKYVAFGQLIEGDDTLKKIESVPTWYESPTRDIKIHKAGILNLECQDIVINKNTEEYIQGHIENLVELGEVLYEDLIKNVYKELDMKAKELHKHVQKTLSIQKLSEDENTDLRATKRFLRYKEEVKTPPNSKSSSGVSEITWDNNEFDVEVYEYEYESEEEPVTPPSLDYQEQGIKPERPYYIPFTDVPYPGERNSTFDLKKFLKGDYCLETDLKTVTPKKLVRPSPSFISEMIADNNSDRSNTSNARSLDSEDQIEIKKYLDLNAARVSFAGGVIRNIAKSLISKEKYNLFEDIPRSDLITDEELRRFRLASIDIRSRDNVYKKKVSVSAPSFDRAPKKIRRRPTGYIHIDSDDIERLSLMQSVDYGRPDTTDGLDINPESSRKVRISMTKSEHSATTQNLAIPPSSTIKFEDTEGNRPSAFEHLYEDMSREYGRAPTLKDYTSRYDDSKTIHLTRPRSGMKGAESSSDFNLHSSVSIESFEKVINLRHGKKAAHKISSDYVKTIDQIEHKDQTSIRSVEFAKKRPSVTVTEYQLQNRKYHEGKAFRKELSNMDKIIRPPVYGINLSGDTPHHSSVRGTESNSNSAESSIQVHESLNVCYEYRDIPKYVQQMYQNPECLYYV